MPSSRSFAAGVIGGIVGAALLMLVLFLLGVTDVKKETTVTVTAPAAFASPGAPSAGRALTPTQIYDREATGVVEITSTFPSTGTDLFGQPTGGGVAVGSGFVVSRQGYILTNAHVVSDSGHLATKLTVMFKGAGSQTRSVSGKIVGVDAQSDVAVVKVDPSGLTLNPLPMGDSNAVQVGEPVVAIGNPLALEFTLTSGIVSAIHRDLSPQTGTNIFNGIQTDAAINEGNSGGPLIDSSGHVIGINEQIATQSGGNEGLGFAVPIDSAVGVMGQLKKSGSVTYAWLGISGETLTADVAQALGIKTTQGVLVTQVRAGTPAAKAGLKGGTAQLSLQGQTYQVGGDIITAINNTKLSGMEQLTTIIAAHKPGDVVSLTIVRDSQTKSIKVTLAARPASA